MLFEFLIFFIAITIILFIMICYFLFVDNINPRSDEEEALNVNKAFIGNWKMAMVLITINFIFIAITTLGFFDVEIFHMSHYYAENGTYVATTHRFVDEYVPYAWVYLCFFYIHIMLFIKAGHDAWLDALRTRGQMEYSKYEKDYR